MLAKDFSFNPGQSLTGEVMRVLSSIIHFPPFL